MVRMHINLIQASAALISKSAFESFPFQFKMGTFLWHTYTNERTCVKYRYDFLKTLFFGFVEKGTIGQ